MATEIERRFLLASDEWRSQATSERTLRQGYLVTEEQMSLRVRISADRAWMTLKGRSKGASRSEFEYPVPLADAEAMMEEFCDSRRIDKRRYEVPVGSHTFEIDVFEGRNAGLVIAEVELSHEAEAFARPDWLGPEVTDQSRYVNARLAVRPYDEWSDGERAG